MHEVCSQAMQIIKHFVSFDADIDWNLNKLLPPILFLANPGLLNTDFKSLGGVLGPVFGQFPELDDVRSLTREEVTKDFVFDALVGINHPNEPTPTKMKCQNSTIVYIWPLTSPHHPTTPLNHPHYMAPTRDSRFPAHPTSQSPK
jgi:hypothetical protein